MNVNVESLGTFSRAAHEGAERAAQNLSGMTGIETEVDVTKMTLASSEDLARDDEERVAVAIDFDGGIRGGTLLSFAPESAETLLDALMPGEALSESAVCELGNVVTSGFVDGWADELGTTIDITPPEYVEGEQGDLLLSAGLDDEQDHAFVFRSHVGAVGEELDVAFHMFPDPESMDTMLADGDDIPLEKLGTLREMAHAGATTASQSVSTMTGIDTEVDITTLSFVPVEDVPAELSEQRHVGVVLSFEGMPGGYVMILLDESSAREVAAALVPGTETVESFDGMAQSAMQELGNVMASSFIDGWANVLETSIEISTPQFVHDMGTAIADSLVARLGQRQEFAFFFDATLHADDREFDCGVYAIPDEEELREALAQLEVGATAERTTKAGSLEL
ncbi:chemotaxis protein CheC [Halorussus halophilus]|uniref:chemotaxis protein CheC n=1 Tax=Halorussus halophilus TaxID=2650975 RepID=UPI0013017459|nr:chemotaxis protein CheC [Halorussus halophilus]